MGEALQQACKCIYQNRKKIVKIVKNHKWKKSIEVCFFLVFATFFNHISFNLSLCSNNIALNTPFIGFFHVFETISIKKS